MGGLVTILTLGICYPWAFCMVYRWETKHAAVNGHRRFSRHRSAAVRQLNQVAAADRCHPWDLWFLAGHCPAQVENQTHSFCQLIEFIKRKTYGFVFVFAHRSPSGAGGGMKTGLSAGGGRHHQRQLRPDPLFMLRRLAFLSKAGAAGPGTG